MTEKVFALIPARSGSKSVVDKNIRPIAGMPLMVWSIRHALECPEIERAIVSTDSESYAEIARKYGAETPFLRPNEFAEDFSTDLEVFRHALLWLKENEGEVPEILVHLRPTCPYRRLDDLSAMIRLLKENPEADSVRSLVKAPETPYKMWTMEENGLLRPAATCDVPEAYNAPRQALPQTYLHNGSIDVLRSRTVLEKNSMTGPNIVGYVMEKQVDIDTEEQFRAADLWLAMESDATVEKRTFCIDIDGVVAQTVSGLEYGMAEPLPEGVRAVNRLYERGHRIVLFTARGTMTGVDWSETTRVQMERWGVKYHELKFGKPAADFYVDDRMLSLALFHDFGG